MAQQNITIGTADAKAGDTLFSAFTKTQSNFTELYGLNTDSVIIVKQSNIATTIGTTIDSTKVYLLDGVIDFTGTGLSITVPVGGINIVGYTFDVSKLICSDDSYTLFNSGVGDSGGINGDNYAIEITGSSSQVYDLTDSTGNNAIELVKVNYNDCTSLGELNGYRQAIESGTGRFGGKPQLTLSGTWSGGYFIDTSLVRGLTDGTYSLFKEGASFTMASRFRSNQNIDLPASASILDFTGSDFLNSSTLQLHEVIVTRSGSFNSSDTNLTPNITASNLACDWVGNNGLPNTFVGGKLNITVEVATTISVVSTFYDLLGTYTQIDLQHFDEPANGQLRHLGTSPQEYTVTGQLILDSSANNEVDLKVVIYRAATTSFEDGATIRRVINNNQGGRDVAYFVLDDDITLNQNDYVKLQVANDTASNDITAELDSYFKVKAR